MLFRLSVTPEPLLFIFCNSMLPEVSPLHSLDLLHVPGNVGRHQVYPTTRRNSFNSCEAVGDDASAPRRWYAAQRWAASGATVGMRVEPGHRSAGRPPKASWRRPGTHTREARGTPRTTARTHPHRPCRAGRSDSIHPLWRSPVGPSTGSRPRMRSGRVPRARPRARGSRGPRCPNDRRRASTRRARTRRWRRSTSRCATTSDVSSSVLGLRPSETRGSVARGSVNRRDTSCWRAAGWRARRKREDAPRFRSRASELPWFLRGRDYPWTRLRFRFGCTRRRNIGAGGVHQWIDNSVEETQSKVVATRVFRVLVAAGCSFLWVAACRSGPDENMRRADIRYERVMPPPEPKPEPEPEPELHPVTVQRVDCRRASAPAWCEKVRYATESERRGTLVLLFRGEVEGPIHWCMPDRSERFRYLGEADSGRVPESVRRRLGVLSVGIAPTASNGAEEGRFFVVRAFGGTGRWEQWSPCPWHLPTPEVRGKSRPRKRREATEEGFASQPWTRACCKVCSEGEPCGDSCIARHRTCHEGLGCAC